MASDLRSKLMQKSNVIVKDNAQVLKTLGGGQSVDVSMILPNPKQPRIDFEKEDDNSLQELMDSIEAVGLRQPISVYDNEDGTYTLISGERRLRAFKALGIKQIPVFLDTKEDGSMLRIKALVENLARENLNPIESALSIAAEMEENGWTQEELAKKLAYSQSKISKLLSILKLSPSVQTKVRNLEYTVVSVLSELSRVDKSRQMAVLNHIINNKLVRDEALAYAKSKIESTVKEPLYKGTWGKVVENHTQVKIDLKMKHLNEEQKQAYEALLKTLRD